MLDANVLIALHRRDHPAHVVATAWIERQLEAVTALGVPITSVVALVRICANRRSYPVPSTQADAFTFLDRLLKHPLMQVVHPGPRHLALPSALCQDYDVRGPMVTDAHIAALAAERGASVVTFDRDFARFTRVRWENPAD